LHLPAFHNEYLLSATADARDHTAQKVISQKQDALGIRSAQENLTDYKRIERR